jgi:glycosyltransferase involved in cell wall biosynthesis
MRVGILGTRGIPNAYGGFEQFAQYLALGLTRKGHEVFVYNSSDHPFRQNQWNGVGIIHCKDWEKRIGTAGQFLYDYNCFRDAARRDYDILLHLGYTSSSVWYRLWPAKAINIVNMDGLEWKRSKYNRLTQRFLQRAEGWAVKYADVLVADSTGIRNYLREQYDKDSVYIPYGAEIPETYDTRALERLNLAVDGYLLIMARIEPENNIEMILQGWIASDREWPLVIIGAIYDLATVNALRHYSHLYFHGHSVGGTNPSLLEAMACGCDIAAHDNIFNRAVLGADARYFSTTEGVSSILTSESSVQMRTDWRERNLEKIMREYRWEKIIDDYEKLFRSS